MADGEQMATAALQMGGNAASATAMAIVQLLTEMLNLTFKMLAGLARGLTQLFFGEKGLRQLNQQLDKIDPNKHGLKTRRQFNKIIHEKGTQAVEMDLKKYAGRDLESPELNRLLTTLHRDMPGVVSAGKNSQGHQVIYIEKGCEADFRRSFDHYTQQKASWGQNIGRALWRAGHSAPALLATNLAKEITNPKEKQLKNEIDSSLMAENQPQPESPTQSQQQKQSNPQPAPTSPQQEKDKKQDSLKETSLAGDEKNTLTISEGIPGNPETENKLSEELKGRHVQAFSTTPEQSVGNSQPDQPSQTGDSQKSPYEQAKEQQLKRAQQRLQQLPSQSVEQTNLPESVTAPDGTGKPTVGKNGKLSVDDVKQRLSDAQHKPSKPTTSQSKPVKTVSTPKMGK